MGYEPLHHKYRPQTFTQLVGQDAIATTLSHALAQQRIAPAYLLCGPRGTGKTSSARILAKSLNCLSHPAPHPNPCGQCEVCRGINNGSILDIVEIDAASNTGVDNIRELIERAQFAPVQCRYKVYVIDECHMLSTAAFNALLKTLEEPPAYVVFVLATTDPQRVLPTIISRCQRFDFRRIPLEAMVGHLQMIAQQESIHITEEAVRLVAQVAQGGLRDAESLLDQLSLLEPPVTAEKVWDLVGAVPERDLLALVQAIATDDGIVTLETVRKLMDRGREPIVVLQNLAGFYRDLIIAKTAGQRSDLVAVTPPTWEAMQTFTQALPLPLLLSGQQTLRQAEAQLRHTTQPRLWLEVTLMGLLPSALSAEPAISATPVQPVNAPLSKVSRPKPTTPLSPSLVPSTSKTVAPAEAVKASVQTGKPTSASIGKREPATTKAPAEKREPIAPSPDEPTVVASSETPAPPTVEQVSPPVIPEVDLGQIWAQVIGYVQPLGTRALLQQQGHLLSYDGQVAHIGIKSRPLFKMAQGRVVNIETAFQQLFSRSVKVTLEVADAPKASSPEPNALPSPLPANQPPSFRASEGMPAPTTSASITNPPVPEVSSVPQPQSPAPVSPTAWTPVSDFDRTVQRFAEFFNGQIVSLEEEEDSPTNGKSASGENVSLKPPASPDSDVPF
ncbi:MAG: DNA polymerase III subunit gamma/tau [Leptolyngbya sp. SIO1D8]|nr:DNA polymerase III subunit gamma/tau [Leptolyngbya sp. SIO1D8]